MDLGVRFYLFADVGLQRISQRLMNGLAKGTDAMPQYAGTKLRVANVLVEMDNGKPIKISRADGSFLTFDKNGQVHNDLVASGLAAMETYRALESADRTATERKVAADSNTCSSQHSRECRSKLLDWQKLTSTLHSGLRTRMVRRFKRGRQLRRPTGG